MKTKLSAPEAKNFNIHPRFAAMLHFAPVWVIFLLGFWLVGLASLGPRWEFVPGDLGDGRFNNYILEHFFLWITGKVPSTSYWNAPFFYPFSNVTAFSDNLLGSAPFYAFFRWVGFDRETAFQWWYLFNFITNYAAAAYVLSRAQLKPLAIGFGAFFFTFGIPVLSLGAHLQLYYRFGVPLACYFFLVFLKQPKLPSLAAVAFWLIWQFYLSIYLGLFLVMLLGALTLLAPFFASDEMSVSSIKARLFYWPTKLKQAWVESSIKERTVSILALLGMAACLFLLLWPYYKATKVYSFHREWEGITVMLPLVQSFFISDFYPFWAPISNFFGQNVDTRHEHQLFPGIAMVIILVIGLITRLKSKNSQTAWLFLGSVLVLIILTFNFYGYSMYWLLWNIPGVNSIRAVTRIQMVWLWPLAFFAAWVIDAIMSRYRSRLVYIGLLLLTALLIAEPAFCGKSAYVKAEGLLRLQKLEDQLPQKLPEHPLLEVANTYHPAFYMIEIDAMLLAQELGWQTINGYSGNNPPYYSLNETCNDLQVAIKRGTAWFYENRKNRMIIRDEIAKNIVMIGFPNCELPLSTTPVKP